MSRILAFDYGLKRTGIAVTDELQLIASGLTTVNTNEIFDFIATYLKSESVSLFVVGEAKQLNNQPSESAIHITAFVQKLKNIFPNIPIIKIDERFTSKMAVRTMIDSGLSKKQRQNKKLLDKISATIILQSYLYNR
ncbi:MAG: Holliday junction resolvase RuvX [Flavobacteriaceae bacterium]|nr:Holliday junction resolvase RuvX [Flavobacteriaceae bacterium]